MKMNDRLKFRVAVKQGVEWQIYDVLNILFKQDGTIWVQTIRESESATFTAWWLVDGENVILEQCTGLKDNNGKLIYEGDVVKCDIDFVPNGRVGLIRTVIFKDGAFQLISVDGSFHFIKGFHNIEIVGNIHKMELSEK